jgi:hypothetical protein
MLTGHTEKELVRKNIASGARVKFEVYVDAI